jgi:hypothetical protein
MGITAMARPSRKGVDQALLQAFACGGTVESAARKAGVTERTVYRRLADAKFQGQLNQLKADMVQRAAGMLTAASLGSVKTLVDMQQDVSMPAAVRRRAARDVLELATRYRELADTEERLRAVEERLGSTPGANTSGEIR